MFTIEQHPDRAAWLAARSTPGRVSASQVADLLGVTPGGEWRAWCRHHAPHLLDTVQTSAMLRGQRMEPVALATWGDLTHQPWHAWEQNAVAVSTRWPWLTCTPDGYTNADEPIEAKTTRWGGWPESGDLDLATVEADPTSGQRTDLARFVFQAMTQAAVLGSDRAHVVVLGPWLDDAHHYTIATPPKTIEAFIAAVSSARERMMSAEHPPVDTSDLCDLWLRQPRIPERTDLVEADDETWAYAEAWQAAVREREAASEREAATRAALLDAIQNVPGIVRGSRRVAWVQPKGKPYRFPKASGFGAATVESK